jgi:iron complex transport system permease protein
MPQPAIESDALSVYKQSQRKSVLLLIVLCALLPVLVLLSAGLGVMNIPASETARILAGKLTGKPAWYEGIRGGAVVVVWELRLPRLICGVFVGAGLAAAGVIFQAILQNPLADPYTLGVSSGAAFGASLAIFFNTLFFITLPLTVLSLGFAGLTLGAVLLIAERGNGLLSANMIMAGIIAGAIFQAGISFLKMLSGENVGAIVFWLMGSLSSRSWGDAALLVPVIAAALTAAFIFAGDLNVLSLGSRAAETLGVNARKTRLLYLLLGAAITAVCVSVCGVIGFVGLVVPHLLRFSVTSDNRLLLPLSALLGALLLCVADNFARLLSTGEIPVGVLTTLLGGPFFIYIFVRRRGARE